MATIEELTTKLNQALKIKEQIEALEQQFDAILSGTSVPKKKMGRPAGKQKRTMSPATIAKMRVAQQARWAHLKASPAKKSTPVKAAPIKMVAKKKTMSPEARAKIAAATKARWEAKRKSAEVKS